MSDDDILTSSGEPLSPPSEQRPAAPSPIADAESRQEAVKTQFSGNLKAMASGVEDASDYARERETQEKFLSGEDLSAQQMVEWHSRANAALERALDAQARARGETPPSQQQTSQQIPGYVAPDDPNYDQHFEAARQRFAQYFDNPSNIGDELTAADHKAMVTNWLTTYDPQGQLTGHLMASAWGPQMAEALANEPTAIEYLTSIPAALRAQQMAKLEGFVAAKAMQAQQNSYASREPEPRRETQAPPPIRPPRGGANPPKDLFSMAQRSDVSDYVKQRREQEHRARQNEDWERWR